MIVVSFSNRDIDDSISVNNNNVGQAAGDLTSQTDYWWCSDSDGGQNYQTKGVVIGVDKSGDTDPKTDYCDSESIPNGLMEAYCNGVYADYSLYDCPNGCKDGACIQITTPTCFESDGGINYYVRGTIKGTDRQGDSNPGIDYCTYGPNLMEGFCDSGYANFILYDCPNGCFNGACINSNSTLVKD